MAEPVTVAKAAAAARVYRRSGTITRTPSPAPTYTMEAKGWLSLPCAVSTISSDFGTQYVARLGYDSHSGIDFPVAFGSSVVSPADGTAAETGMHKDYAQYIMINTC